MSTKPKIKSHILGLLKTFGKGKNNSLTVEMITDLISSMGLNHQVNMKETVTQILHELYKEGKIDKTSNITHEIEKYYIPEA